MMNFHKDHAKPIILHCLTLYEAHMASQPARDPIDLSDALTPD